MWNLLFPIISALSSGLAPTSLDKVQEGGKRERQEISHPLWKGSRWPSEGLVLGMIQAGTRMHGNAGSGILEGSFGVLEASVQLGARRCCRGTCMWREGLGDILQSSSLPSNGKWWPGRHHGLALGPTGAVGIRDEETHRKVVRFAPEISS